MFARVTTVLLCVSSLLSFTDTATGKLVSVVYVCHCFETKQYTLCSLIVLRGHFALGNVPLGHRVLGDVPHLGSAVSTLLDYLCYYLWLFCPGKAILHTPFPVVSFSNMYVYTYRTSSRWAVYF